MPLPVWCESLPQCERTPSVRSSQSFWHEEISVRFIYIYSSRRFYLQQHISKTRGIKLSNPGFQAWLQCCPSEIKVSVWQFCWSEFRHIWVIFCHMERRRAELCSFGLIGGGHVLLESPPDLRHLYKPLQDKTITNSLSLSLALSFHLSIPLQSFFLSFSLSISPSLSHFLFLTFPHPISLSISIPPFSSPFLSPSIFLSINQSFHLSPAIFLSLSPSFSFHISSAISLSLSPFLNLSISLFYSLPTLHLSPFISLSPSISLSAIFLFISLSHPCLFPSISLSPHFLSVF